MAISFGVSNSRRSIFTNAVFSAVIVGFLTIFYFVDKKSYVKFGAEDSLAENFTCIFYFIGGLILIVNSIVKIKKGKKIEIFSVFFGFLFILFAGEEISWGQRIFNISEPSFIKGHTFDNDFSFHNLYFFGNRFFEGNRLLNLFVFITGVLLPLIYFNSHKIRKLLNKINFPVVPLSFSPLFFLGLAYGSVMSRISHLYEPAEIKEFIFSLGYLLFSFSVALAKNRLEPPEKI